MFFEPGLIQNRFRLLILLRWDCLLDLERSLTLCRRRYAHEMRSIALEVATLAFRLVVVSAHEGCCVSLHAAEVNWFVIRWFLAFLHVHKLLAKTITVLGAGELSGFSTIDTGRGRKLTFVKLLRTMLHEAQLLSLLTGRYV